ncbi:MAG: acetyl-CoA carboxylase biotin carboxyl carrier protein [Alphaproteobacteria bacterium]|jgi:acetyl-CoA carboxylase biotin carboxyl carrier protein|uniref:acetyl-CoA carboxylase biotin carboxyl carrier protein n=1 Tax=Maricaulis alexandrii TaxID=2570354 RepID=UPI0011095949|nr:acetyl-CoA carboxylase biotin carboxyl carrier protein [Maricaulis alexandrii]MCR9268166.1 acetyl-CoA carboxylase biotin carboxyl carrier protein [Alphaproteobacteria bacterium]
MSSDSRSRTPIDPALVRELADILRETELSEIEVEHDDLRLRIARQLTAAPVAQTISVPAAAPAAAAPAPAAEAAPAAAAPAGDKPGTVKSPMVGTAYLKPNPDSANFVRPGDAVKKGDTILLVEAMKTFNPITAEKDGTVTDLLVDDGQPVEYGEPLFVLS